MIKPVAVTEVDLVFGGVVEELLPAMTEIPEAFITGETIWNAAIDRLFYKGPAGIEVTPRKEVDPKAALRHIAAVLNSFQPKHEHKMAGCAYLMSEFFETVTVA